MNLLNSDGTPIVSIKVMGVGGGGNNAVNRMIASGVKGAKFIAVNTDKQMLLMNKADEKLQIGVKMTRGQGAGSDPEVGKKAAEESEDAIKKVLENTDLLFITAGMGGGTGTGAAPVIAKIAKEMGIVTVAIVTKPFQFEGQVKMRNAEAGIEELRKYVDTIVIIPNAKLTKILPKNTSALQAYMYADDVLRQGIQGISDIITRPNMINVDFADIKKVVKGKGRAHMGIGHGKGEHKMMDAVQEAIASPLLETSIEGATGLIYNVRYCLDLPMSELNEVSELIEKIVSPDCNIIHGNGADETLVDEVEITVIATGFDENKGSQLNSDGFKSFNSEGFEEFKNRNQNDNSEIQAAAEKIFKNNAEIENRTDRLSSLIKDDEESDIPPFLRLLRDKNKK